MLNQLFSRFKSALLTLVLLTVALAASAQDTLIQVPTAENPFLPGTTVDLVLSWQSNLLAVLLTLLTYLAPYVAPGVVEKIKIGATYGVLALSVGLLAYFTGFASSWQVMLGVVLSALGYDKFLKPFGFVTRKILPKRSNG